ncbi:MAG: glutaredoxin family protein [Chloroflexi bacterium]|nr:glutaredoxin family protein [Chloroflexota bacterium]
MVGRFWRRAGPADAAGAVDVGTVTVTLYGKDECHLCDNAADILTSLADNLPFTWRKVDIHSDPSLWEQYRYRIPVIAVDGGQVLEWPTTRERVRRAILARGR